MRIVSITKEDVELTIRQECDPEIMLHLGGPRTEEQVRDVHSRRLDLMSKGNAHMFKILADDSNEILGTVGIWRTEREGEKSHEMGWIVMPEHQGKGVATEGARMVIEDARTRPGVTLIYAFPATDNPASNAICRKLGFELIGEEEFDFAGRTLHCNVWRLDLRA